MGSNDSTWLHVQEIVDHARQEIVDSVKAMLAKVNTEKIDALNKICHDYNAKIWLVMDEDGSNPFLIRPLMYIWFTDHEALHGDVMGKWQSLLREMGWASSARITLKLIEKPYEGTSVFQYPHVWGENDGQQTVP